MKVKVRYLSVIKDLVELDEEVIEMNGDSINLNEFINKLISRRPRLYEVEEYMGFMVLVNGKVPTPDTKIKDGDEIELIPVASGG